MRNRFFIVLFLAAIMSVPALTLAAEQKDGIDALLLIDVSGSMRDSDSSRNAIEATKMFIDMLETKNSRVGIIGFNDSLAGVIDITEIASIEDKERLKRAVDEFNYAGWTDIGLSLKEAVGMMSNSARSTNSPMVLLLTDGKIQLGENNRDRSVEESYDDVAEAINANGLDLPIYTIGLNYDGSVDRQLLRTISETSGGRSYVIAEAESLPQIFNEIFADHVKSTLVEVASFTADGGYTDVNIDIDSDFVAVANVIMLSEKGILDARLYDPADVETVFDQETITFSSSKKYSIIKILFAQKGPWQLQVKGATGDQVRVNLIYQYNISIDVSVTQNEAVSRLFDSTAPLTIAGNVLVNSEPISDDTLYRSASTNAIITDTDGNLIAKTPMTATPDGLVGSYTPVSDEPVVVYIEMTTSTFVKESSELIVQFEKLPAVRPELPAPPSEPVPEEVSEVGSASTGVLWLYIVAAAVLLAVVLLAVVLFVLLGKRKPKCFDGYLDIRVMNERGVYTLLETSPLYTYVGTIDLNQFLMDNMPPRVKEEIAGLPFSVKNVTLTPASDGRDSAILFENHSDNEASSGSGEVGKKFLWRPGQKVVICNTGDDTAKLEMTYIVDALL